MDHLNGRVDEDVASGVEPRFFCFCFGGLFGEGEGPGAAELDVDEDITAKSLTTSTSCSTIEQLEACSFLRFGTELFIFHRRTEGTIPLDVTGEHENENEYGYKRRRRRERTLIPFYFDSLYCCCCAFFISLIFIYTALFDRWPHCLYTSTVRSRNTGSSKGGVRLSSQPKN